MKIWA